MSRNMRGPAKRQAAEEELRDFARLLVRADLTSAREQEHELAAAIRRAGLRVDADAQATAWLSEAGVAARADQLSWPERTDHDALVAVFGACEQRGVRVLQGIPDHWGAKAELDQLAGEYAGAPLRGVLWFTAPDVWHAVDEGMLEVNLWHATTANAAPGDALLDDVLSVFAAHGVHAHFDEGRIEVSAHWRRRV